jgi:hypothetical protein
MEPRIYEKKNENSADKISVSPKSTYYISVTVYLHNVQDKVYFQFKNSVIHKVLISS